jgi:predicted HAD superfamily Cof-like phosphohydrolase
MSNQFDPHADVIAMHRKYGLGITARPLAPSAECIKHRIDMINEETDELIEAIESGDLVKIAREAVDVIAVVLGTIIVYGLPYRNIWRAVHTANMRKAVAQGNTKAAKPIKPPGWKSPDQDIKVAIYGKGRVDLFDAQAKVIAQEGGEGETGGAAKTGAE